MGDVIRRLKNDWALSPLRVHGIERIQLDANPDAPRQAVLRVRKDASRSARGVVAALPGPNWTDTMQIVNRAGRGVA